MKSSYALILLVALLGGCSSSTHSANSIRVIDSDGIPIKNAFAHFSYDVPYTIAYLDAGPTDGLGYAKMPYPYKITRKSRVTVTSENGSASLDSLNLGFIMNGLLTLTVPRENPAMSTGSSIKLPSVYISKEAQK